MEFYEAVNRRRTIRDFKNEQVDMGTIKRILSAGLKAPSNDHMRNWEFVVIRDKDVIAAIIKKIPKRITDKRLDFITKSFKDECQHNMYKDAIPKQYQMLYEAGCLVLPFFKQKASLLEPKSLGSLNNFASMWCCIENIFLAAAAEGLACAFRIPMGDEAEQIKDVINHPGDYRMPCYLSIGYPADDAAIIEQKEINPDERIHINQW